MRSQETLLLMSLHQDTLRGCLKLHPSTNITQFLISLRLTFPKETVETVARRLSSSPSVGGTDSRLLQHWQLRFGAVSCKLCSVVVMIVDWLLNRFLPSWAAFQALTIMAGLCCGVDKGSALYWWNLAHLFAKFILFMAGSEAKEACAISRNGARSNTEQTYDGARMTIPTS